MQRTAWAVRVAHWRYSWIAIVASECGKLVANETKIDILVTPSVTILVGCLLSMACAPSIGAGATAVGSLIMWATELEPFFMGILVSALVGIALTLPISSAAICAALSLTGLAGGAAVAGCCAQMVGFAVMSFKENRWGGLISQGLGTSMLQMGNIVRNPRIWIPPTLASVITGPIATCIFQLKMNGPAISSGMGACGLVGPIGVYTGWVADMASGAMTAITAMDWAGLVLICLVLPAVLTYAFGLVLRKIGWIKEGDLTLESARRHGESRIRQQVFLVVFSLKGGEGYGKTVCGGSGNALCGHWLRCAFQVVRKKAANPATSW